MILYIDTPKTTVSVKNSGFFIENEIDKKTIMPNKISQIILGNSILVNTDALILAEAHKIPIHIENAQADIKVTCRSINYGLDAGIRKSQVAFVLNTKKRVEWSISLFKTKLENQIGLVQYLAERKKRIAEEVKTFKTEVESTISKIQNQQAENFEAFRESVQGNEGSVARKYWSILSEVMAPEWQFENRNRQPAADAFNASLNYLYSMLYGEVENQLYLAGLDAHQGIFHAEQYQKPVLSFDFIEMFRVWCDRLLIDLIWNEELQVGYYYFEEQACMLNKNAKAVIIPEFKNMMNSRKMFGGRNALAKEHIRIAIENLKTQF